MEAALPVAVVALGKSTQAEVVCCDEDYAPMTPAGMEEVSGLCVVMEDIRVEKDMSDFGLVMCKADKGAKNA